MAPALEGSEPAPAPQPCPHLLAQEKREHISTQMPAPEAALVLNAQTGNTRTSLVDPTEKLSITYRRDHQDNQQHRKGPPAWRSRKDRPGSGADAGTLFALGHGRCQ